MRDWRDGVFGAGVWSVTHINMMFNTRPDSDGVCSGFRNMEENPPAELDDKLKLRNRLNQIWKLFVEINRELKTVLTMKYTVTVSHCQLTK